MMSEDSTTLVPMFAPMVWEGNLAENWKTYYQNFEIYVLATGKKTQPDEVRCALLLCRIGAEGMKLYNTFVYNEEADKLKVNIVSKKFEEYCCPKTNRAYERYKFWKRDQSEYETFAVYLTDLKKLAAGCEFGDQHNSLICDRIVCGITSDALREKLLRKDDLTLENAVKICQADEVTRLRVDKMQAFENSAAIQTVRYTNNHLRSNGRQKPFRRGGYNNNNDNAHHSKSFHCINCHRVHVPGKCAAKGKQCFSCKKMDHFQRCCPEVINEVGNAENADIEPYTIEAVSTIQTNSWYIDLRLSSNSIIHAKVDTGAQSNCMSLDTFNKYFPGRTVMNTSIKLVDYSHNPIPVAGRYNVICYYKGNKVRIPFTIVNMKANTIIGLHTCRKLNLVNEVGVVGVQQDIFTLFEDVFTGLGSIAGKHTIRTDPSVTPVVHPARRVPFSTREKLKSELNRMVGNNIISPVDIPTPWVNSLVCTHKKDGTIRVCLDPKDLNRAILREHYTMPTRDELLSRLSGVRYISKLDASNGFWQIKLDEASSYLTTFNTPFGRYRYNVLPFGICSAPEVFHKSVRHIFEHMPGVETSMDDILVYGKTRKEHDERLFMVLKACREANLKLNRNKCEFGKTSVLYMGDIVSVKGLQPDPQKVSAINDMATPTCKQDVLRFLGMVNFQARFVPNLSSYTAPLRELLNKKQDWVWESKHQGAFTQLKHLISTAPVLRFFDPSREIKVSTDASKSGLGCVLSQKYGNEYFPVAYAARAMTSPEQRYAMIEKELLGIVFGCEKFHQYIYMVLNM